MHAELILNVNSCWHTAYLTTLAAAFALVLKFQNQFRAAGCRLLLLAFVYPLLMALFALPA